MGARRWAALALLAAAASAAAAARPSECPPGAPSPSPFWANDSLVGVQVDCADAQKDCLAIGRLLYQLSGRCYPLGDSRPCADRESSLVVDADALRNGRLRSVCRRDDSCSGRVMAYDDKCYNLSDIYITLCDDNVTIVPYLTGGYECVPFETPCALETTIVLQPNSSGRCTLPNFREQNLGPFRVQCSSSDVECLQQNSLPYQGGCYSPLTKATCSEGQWLVLDEAAATSGLLQAECSQMRPCWPEGRRLRVDGRCHSLEELQSTLCPGEWLLALPTGDVICSLRNMKFTIDIRERSGFCEINVLATENEFRLQIITDSVVPPDLRSPCGPNDEGNCQPEVVTISPRPGLTPED